jgi:DNA-binding LacI/PurR family transcriptional regulator
MNGHVKDNNAVFLFTGMPRRSKITMDHVARAAGVSIQTVSAVINNKSGISEKTRARIRKIIARLDYQPNLLASSLRGQRSFTIGVLIPSIANPFYPELVRGIEDEAQRHGYSLFLCNSDEDPEKEVNYLHLLRRHRIAGLIAGTINEHPAWTQALKNLAAQGVSIVLLLGASRPSEKITLITTDDQEGLVKVTSHLLDLGHDRIGMIMPPLTPTGEQPRVTGFVQAHALRGKKVEPEVLVQGGWHVTEGQEGALQLMRLPVPPTAIVAPNDMAAIGAITKLRHPDLCQRSGVLKLKEMNLKVPDDVAVVGFDNISIARWYDPPLTTVDQPRHQMGERAMQELLKRFENPSTPAEVVKFETSLIIRHSSGGPRVKA